MNFAALPPEVNSALMYSGAGSGPIRAAASAWKTMAAELESAANSYRTVIAGLTDETWQGPAATAMAAAAAPYAAWMSTTAAQAGQAGTHANAAAAAYETAFAMTVPPAVIAANRTQLATLTATNLLGQNTAAIAANEALYAEMWAQDATAMYGYAGTAATATQLPTFTAPHNTATPNPTTTSSAVQTAGNAAATHALSTAGHLAGSTAESADAISPGLAFDLAGAVLEVASVGPFGGIGLGGAFGGLAITLGELAFPEGAEGLGALGGLGLIGQATPGVGALGSASGPVGATWASVGKAVPLGSLSVPQAWAAAAPSALREVALVSAQSGTAATAAAGAEAPYAEMALSSMAGRAMAGSAAPGRGVAIASQPNPKPAAPPKPAEEPEEPDKPDKAKAIGVVAELRALVELRDSGVLTQERFIQRKQRLLGE
ncbi:PPE domain-containing protein [Mycobacterium sp. CSUR Q5927]|nr:PPE domain-containing protein [Mycobacterium sp. CSUR Q5927]